MLGIHTVRCAGLALVAISWGAATSAYAAPVGDQVAADGGSEMLVNAGDAIQLTCVDLTSPNAGKLNAQQTDLRNRCREMVQTILPPASGPGFGYQFETTEEEFDAIRQFSGEETSSQGRFATDDTNRQFSAIATRLDAIRAGTRTGLASANGLQFGGAASADEDADLGVGWFTNVAFGNGGRDGTDNESEYDFDTVSGTLGLDYAFANGLVIGVAGGYGESDVDYADDPAAFVNSVSGGGIESDGYTASAFASWAGASFYANAIASTGENDFDLERRAFFTVPSTSPLVADVVDRTFTAETDSEQVAAQGTVGVTFGDSAAGYDVMFDAFVGADYLSVEVDGYTEDEAGTGGLALTFDDQDIDSTQSIVGLTLRMTGNTSFAVLQPYAGAEWRHEFENDSRTIDYRYAFALTSDANGDGTTAPSFSTPTDEPDEDWAQLTVGLGAQLANSFFVFLQYDSVVGLEDTIANAFTFGLRGKF